MLKGHELPLKLQLDHVQKKPYLELRLLQIRDPLAPSMMSSRVGGAVGGGMVRTDSEESLEEDGHNILPKEEGKRRREDERVRQREREEKERGREGEEGEKV